MKLLAVTAAAAVAIMSLTTPALAQSNRVPVTDPETLVSLGYPPDATNIHRLLATPGEVPMPHPGDDSTPHLNSFDPFAAGGPRDTTATGFAFFPLTHTNEYLKGPSFLVMNGGLASITPGGVYENQWNIPDAAMLTYLDTFGYHNEASRLLTVTLIERCLGWLAPGNPVETVLMSRGHPDADGNFFHIANIPQHRVDASQCSYHTRVRFSDADAPSPSLNMQLTKVRLFWTPDRIFGDGFEPPEEEPLGSL